MSSTGRTENLLTFRRVTAVGFMAISLFACGRESMPGQQPESVPPPPSLSQADEESNVLIQLDDRQVSELLIAVKRVEKAPLTYPIMVPGVAFPAPENISIVSAPVNGRVAAIYAHEGERVKKGQVLLELESLEFANLVAEFIQAGAEAEYQRSNLDRLQLLVEKKISPQRALEKAQSDFQRSQAAATATRARLQAVGVNNPDLIATGDDQRSQTRLKIYAAIDGMVNEHLIDMGQAVTAYERMLTVLNLDKVLVRGYVSPEDGIALKPGDPVTISLKDYAQLRHAAEITSINPALDEINKSVTVNILVSTPNHWPKPGQNVHLEIFATTPEPVLSIPFSAVEYEGQNATVFVKKNERTYEKRTIFLRRFTGDLAIVESGLMPGEEVAVSQVFSLKALSKFEEFSE